MSGVPVAAKAIAVTFSQEQTGVVGLKREATATIAGLWQADGIVLPSAGDWTITLAVRIDDFTLDELAGTVTLGE